MSSIEDYNSYLESMLFQRWWGSTCPQLTYEKAIEKYIQYLIEKDMEEIIKKYQAQIRFCIKKQRAKPQKTRKNKKS